MCIPTEQRRKQMKTSELTGAALDWAVAKCEPDDTLAIYFDESTGEPLCHDDWPDNQEYKPSTDWAQGGPIIERELIDLRHIRTLPTMFWEAYTPAPEHDDGEVCVAGPTPLIAAMRCYVASKLGDEVEVPKELT
jgi:hypothetical protein